MLNTRLPEPLPERAFRQNLQGAERRRSHRTPVVWAAQLETPGGTQACTVLNVSVGGAKLWLAAPLPLHEPVTLVLERFGRFPAETVWAEDETMGIRFTGNPFDVASALGMRLLL